MKFLLSLILALPLATHAQQAPTVLRPGHMQAQAHGGATNRPDRAPQFPGGPAALGKFFQENIQYPEAARVKGITGNVLLNATVGADGRLSMLSLAKSLSPDCDAEALRVAGLLPAWQPATRLGEPLPVQIQLPVPFGNASILKLAK
jgi:protein TonB